MKSAGWSSRQISQFFSFEAPVHQISPSRTSQAPGLLSQPSKFSPLKMVTKPLFFFSALSAWRRAGVRRRAMVRMRYFIVMLFLR